MHDSFLVTDDRHPAGGNLVLRDAPPQQESLVSLFRDSHSLFRVRIQKLGKLSDQTTQADVDSLRVMLEVLIWTKRIIQRNPGP